jgi:hypothetical protein
MATEPLTNGDWGSCKMHVLRELQRLNGQLEKMDEKLDRLKDQLTLMQVKVAGIAAIAGLVVTIIANLIIKSIGGA